ncbi:hypothetical protein KIPB_015053, partial [Kipferlia bialata]
IEYVAAKKAPKDQHAKIMKEATYLNSVTHPNIVRFVTCANTDTANWVLMEFCGGGNLDSIIQGEGMGFP